jgi:hypothetical protein
MPSVKLPEGQGAVKRREPTYCAAPSAEGDVSLMASAGERGTAAMVKVSRGFSEGSIRAAFTSKNERLSG